MHIGTVRKQRIEWSEKRRQRRWFMTYGPQEEALRRCRRWTVRLSIAFAINAVGVIPFFKGNFLHGYWQTVGNALLFLCLCFFLGSVFMAGMTYVVWSYLREMRKIEDNYPKAHT
jgi:hypothetical protein